MTVTARARYLSNRSSQVFSAFDNPWSVLWGMVKRRKDLEFRIGQLTVSTPNAPGARVPVFEVFAEDEYALDWFTYGLADDVVAVDIGAHIGCFALDFVRRIPSARVHSYEPTPSTGGYTVRNVVDNGLGDRIVVHRMAVGASDGTLVMADNGPGSGHNGVLHLGEAGTAAITVPSRSFAEVMSIAGGGVGFVKLDAEGAEYGILLDSDPELLAPVRRFVMEYHPSPTYDFADLRSHLEMVGLNLVRHVEGGPGFGLAWFSRDALA